MKTRTEVIEELTRIVKTDRKSWKASAFDRALNIALFALVSSRPLTQSAELKLITNIKHYPVPNDCIAYIGTSWGVDGELKPWDENFAGNIPGVFLSTRVDGRYLEFAFAPKQKLIQAHGETFYYEYAIAHELTEDVFTVQEKDYELFITRALAALMKELMVANVSDPIQLHRGMGSTPSNSTPSAAHKELMATYNDML